MMPDSEKSKGKSVRIGETTTSSYSWSTANLSTLPSTLPLYPVIQAIVPLNVSFVMYLPVNFYFLIIELLSGLNALIPLLPAQGKFVVFFGHFDICQHQKSYSCSLSSYINIQER